MKKLFTILLFIAILSLNAAAEATFTANAPQRVAEGEKFAVTFRLRNGEGSGLKAPSINGCTLVFGPAISSSQSYSVVNGQTSSSSVYDYTFTYRADKAGTYTIGEATINVGGKKLSTRRMTLTVTAGNGGGQSQAQSQPQQSGRVSVDDISTQSADKPVSNNDVFVRIILSKNSAYEQEAVECTIKLYTKYSISSFFPTLQPSFDGFLIEEVNVQPALNQVETFNGQRYMTALLKKCIIYPQKSGKLTINSGNYDINVVQYDNINMGLFNVQSPKERKIKVSSNSASVNILPLPTPQPAGFTGAVGNFNVSTRLIGNSFRTNEPSTLIYTITGTGNIKYIKEPVIDFPSEFEQYTPKMDSKVRVEGGNTTGTATIEYTFVPQAVGDFKIGGDKFVYFDVNTKQYVTLSTPSYDVKVAKGIDGDKSSKTDIVQKNTDIRHIVTGPKKLMPAASYVVSEWWYWLLMLLPIAALTTTLYVNRRRLALAADVQGLKLAKANKVARKRLRVAEKYMHAKKSDKFYEEILRAMWGYLSDKLAMPVSQLSRDNIIAELTNYGADETVCNNMIRLLDDCEMARYTPVHTEAQLNDEYKLATETINEIEKIKPNKRNK